MVRDETPELRTENVIMCCLVRAIDEYRAMVELCLAGSVIMCCLFRAIDE